MKANTKIENCNNEFSDLKRSVLLKCYKGNNFSKCQNINKNTSNCMNCIAF